MDFGEVVLRLFSQHDLLLSVSALEIVNLPLVVHLLLELVDRVAAHDVHHVVDVIAELLLRLGRLGLILSQVHVGIDSEVSQPLFYLRVLLRMMHMTRK